MNRTVCFAHYDKNNLIQDYVVFYLKELKKFANNIIFVSDSDISEEELKKVNPYIIKAIVGKHGEYDFGSYKRGFLFAKDNGLLNDCEELIFANDSCYAPLFPFDEMFSKMSSLPVDFWGNTENNEGIKNITEPKKHIQSYFIVFKPSVFNSDIFINFINNIQKETTKEQIIAKYEIGLSDLLINNGFSFDTYCDLSKITKASHILIYDKLIENNKSPFLKRSIALYKNNNRMPTFLKQFLKQNTNYPFELIKQDQKLNALKINQLQYLLYLINFIRKSIIKIHLKDKEIILFGKAYSLQINNKIFSLNNIYKNNERYKQIYFLGIKFSFRIKKKQAFDINKINEYLAYKATRKSDTVCYTCITGNYDDLIQHDYIDKNWDYICFTDNQKLLKQNQIGIWEIRPLIYSHESNHYNNRWHKFFPNKIFDKSYSKSIYVDGNVNILTNYLSNEINNTKKCFLLPKHFKNNCIYDELNFIVECLKDTQNNINKLIQYYEQEKLPHNLGFSENNIIYRDLNNTNLFSVMEDWWTMVHQFSSRDQASLVYVLWKHNMNIADFNNLHNTRDESKDFIIERHLK